MITEEQFRRDVKDHVLEVFLDEGVRRHIRIRKPGTMCMHYDLITWPGYLCFTGDMGTYVFYRLEDMFHFFRMDNAYKDKSNVLAHIDRRYWAEKLEASDRADGVKEFDPKQFRREIERQRRQLLVKNFKDKGKDERQDFWDSLQSVINAAHDGKSASYHAVCGWSYTLWESQSVIQSMKHRDIYLDTDDFPDCEVYTFRFMWCCYALRWAIDLYDKAKETK